MRADRIVQSPGRGKPRLRGLAVTEDSDQPDDEQCLASDSAGSGVVVLLASSHGNGDWFPVFPGIGQPRVPIAHMLRRDRKKQTIAEEARELRSRFRRPLVAGDDPGLTKPSKRERHRIESRDLEGSGRRIR